MRTALVFVSSAASVATLLAVLASHAAPQPDLSWMSGYWLSCSRDSEVSETWSDARGGVMLGTSFTLSSGKPSWEFSRIGPSDVKDAPGGGISFFAQPSGQAPAEFRAVRVTARRVVFENLQHDFPHRVIYTREGDRLTGRIEGTIEGQPQSMEWNYVAAKLNQRCPRE